MSSIVLQLQFSLVQSDAQGLLCGCSVLLEADTKQTDLLGRACFGEPIKNLSGEPIINTENNKQWYQLGMEEAFFLCHSLKCLKILGGEDDFPKDYQELWQNMKLKKKKKTHLGLWCSIPITVQTLLPTATIQLSSIVNLLCLCYQKEIARQRIDWGCVTVWYSLHHKAL